MDSIYNLFPTLDDLLSASEDALVPILLHLATNHQQQGGIFYLDTALQVDVVDMLYGNTTPQYLQDHRAIEHLNHAWNYCKDQRLIEQAPGINGMHGFMVFTRLGREIANGTDWEQVRLATGFPRELLHPAIRESAWNDFIKAASSSDLTSFSRAIREAFVKVEDAVRIAGGYKPADYGEALMTAAFDVEKGPLRDSDASTPRKERRALLDFFVASYNRFRNANAHGDRQRLLVDTRDALLLASMLLRIVDEQSRP